MEDDLLIFVSSFACMFHVFTHIFFEYHCVFCSLLHSFFRHSMRVKMTEQNVKVLNITYVCGVVHDTSS